jgi:hypothetical protein
MHSITDHCQADDQAGSVNKTSAATCAYFHEQSETGAIEIGISVYMKII